MNIEKRKKKETEKKKEIYKLKGKKENIKYFKLTEPTKVDERIKVDFI